MNTFSIKEAISYGWSKTKEHFWFVVGVTFLSEVPAIIRNVINHSKSSGFLASIVNLFLFVVGVVLLIGVIRIYLKLNRNETASFSDLLSPQGLFWKFLFADILFGLILFVGLILLIVPGIIFALRYSMALFLVVDKNLGPIDALKESAKITFGHKWQLLGFSVFIIILNILGLLALGIGLLITMPITSFSTMYIYRKLLKEDPLTPKQISI